MIDVHAAGGITTITLNRPDKLNAFAGAMREILLAALRDAAADATCRVVIITGAGRAFCAGGDVEFMAGLQREQNVEAFRKLLDAGREIVTTIVSMNKPVIASVNGVAAGAGCNLALACDMRIASDAAKLGETFVRIGIHPDWGGTWLLPRLVGPSRAMEILMTGRMVGADEALRIGMVDRVVPAAELAAETESLARTIADGPPLAIAAIKRALAASPANPLRDQIELESEHQLAAFRSRDAAEGMAAFFEKRPPRFSGE
jgi:2-(1,2-epoxy-1,2-dihydrophenyl)acetyl-CoA isomerase